MLMSDPLACLLFTEDNYVKLPKTVLNPNERVKFSTKIELKGIKSLLVRIKLCNCDEIPNAYIVYSKRVFRKNTKQTRVLSGVITNQISKIINLFIEELNNVFLLNWVIYGWYWVIKEVLDYRFFYFNKDKNISLVFKGIDVRKSDLEPKKNGCERDVFENKNKKVLKKNVQE